MVTTEGDKQRNYFKPPKEEKKEKMPDIIKIFLHQVKAWCTVNMATMTITETAKTLKVLHNLLIFISFLSEIKQVM